MSSKYKKRIRLKGFEYKGSYQYFVTICTSDKKPLFTDSTLVAWLIELLREQRRFVSAYKQQAVFYYKKKTGTSLWQINYYEHILRKTEDTNGVAYYIFNNPVRKRLVRDFKDYAFLGSFEFDIMQM